MSNLDAATTAETPAAVPESAAAVAKLDDLSTTGRPRSLAGDAWRDLRKNPIFWIGVGIVAALVVVAVFPKLFTSVDPHRCGLENRFRGPGPKAPFGYDVQGCNVYARTIHGARSSLIVGVASTFFAGCIGMTVGLIAGYYGRWVDALLSRVTDVIMSIPYLLMGLVLLRRLTVNSGGSRLWPVVITLTLIGWMSVTRVVRSSVISAKQQDYVQAARMLGAGHGRIMLRHILPNAMAPGVVILTILLGANIASEATFSFLGIGLQPPAISWGGLIADASQYVRNSAPPLLWPSGFLAVTVLSFIMLGDAIRDAFDPRMR